VTVAVDAALVGFVHALRAAGLRVTVDAATTFVAAIAEVGLHRRDQAYWAGRATLVHRHEDVAVYDRVFAEWFGGATSGLGPTVAETPPVRVTLVVDEEGEATDAVQTPHDGPTVHLRWSDREVLRSKDFAACTPDELDEAHRLMADLRLAGASRRSRRLRPSARRADQLDVRRTTRASLRTGGEPMRTHRLGPGERARRLVLLCDVSGSMEPYARALVRFAHVAIVARRQVEVFALGTRLTRLTRALASRDPDAALTRAAAAVADWSGGTRLGDGLRTFNDQWGQRGMARGADVVILSDGWDRGDPDELAEQMARLRRIAHRVIWVNPLKASAGYEPLARGMAAALPHVDSFVEGHSLQSLDALADLLAARSART
jgi:uncharacterized protein